MTELSIKEMQTDLLIEQYLKSQELLWKAQSIIKDAEYQERLMGNRIRTLKRVAHKHGITLPS